MAKQFKDVNTRYGSPMGRSETRRMQDTDVKKLTIRRVKFVDGDYDDGGAYWGAGDPLWHIHGEGEQQFFRACCREHAFDKFNFKNGGIWKMNGCVITRK